MTRTVRGCPTVQLQRESAVELETNPSVPWQEEQADTTEGEVAANYNLDINCGPDGSDPEIEPVNHMEEEVNSNAKYEKMEIPCEGTFKEQMTHNSVIVQIQHVH